MRRLQPGRVLARLGRRTAAPLRAATIGPATLPAGDRAVARPLAWRRVEGAAKMPPPAAAPRPEPPIFETELRAHGALSDSGRRRLALAILAGGAALAALMLAQGLWLIAAMLAADMAFLLALLAAHRRRSQAVEQVRIDRGGLRIRRLDHRRRPVEERGLPLYGLTLERVCDPDFGMLALRMSLRGRAVEVGGCLAPADRAALADAIEDAMRRAGCPPWLRRIERPALAGR